MPLLILSVIALSNFIGHEELLYTLGRYLEWLVPSQSKALMQETSNFLDNRTVIGWALFVTMLFFSSLGFAVLNKAMAIFFIHPTTQKKHHFLVSALLPYLYIIWVFSD